MSDSAPIRRRWLRRLILTAATGGIVLILGAVLAVQNLEWLAKWSLHRLFPGVRAELGSLRLLSVSRLEVRELTLKSAKTGELLLSLENGSAIFRFGDLWHLRLEELQMRRPDLVVSPDLADALGARASQTQPGSTSLRWSIGRLSAIDGHLRVTPRGRRSPTVDMNFSATLENFGVGGEAGDIEHEVRLERIAATDDAGSPFLKLQDADVRFTTDELFRDNHIRAVRVGAGALEVAPGLLDYLAAQAGDSSAAGPPEKAGWSVGTLDFDGVRVTVIDAPGPFGRIEFHLAAQLHELGGGSSKGEATQGLVLRDLRIHTDHEPAAVLLAADQVAAKFTVDGLLRHQLSELTLESPEIDVNVSAFAPSAAKTSASPAMGDWFVGRASCANGFLRVRGLQKDQLEFSTRFAFDWHDFGTTETAKNQSQQLTVWDTQASSGNAKAFLSVDAARARFTAAGLFDQRHVDAVTITGGRVLVGDAFQQLLSGENKNASSSPAEGGWSIGTLDIAGVRLRLEDKREGVPDVRMTLNTSLQDVSAGGVSSTLFDQLQTVELTRIDLNSPLNPRAKIFTLSSVFVRFTLRDLASRHLREVIIREPVIYLSRDLFVYMERATAEDQAKPAAAKPERDWSAEHVEVRSGKLVIGSGGQRDVGLPLEFETTLDHVALDNLAELKVQAALKVPRQSREFPDYQLGIEDVEGDLRFAYPPEKGEKNLVQKLAIRKIRWRQFQSHDAWIAVTFDASGINGQFGGESYRGYVNGGFSFNFLEDSPWQGWVSGTGIDTQALTEVMSPQNFSLTGPLDFELQIDAFRKEIERMVGAVRIEQPGHLKIGKIDDLLANIPSTWTAIKQSSTRLALETLRDFDYSAATGDLWFVESQGILALNLTGPLGSRNFEIVLHDDQETQNRWQHGKLGKQ